MRENVVNRASLTDLATEGSHETALSASFVHTKKYGLSIQTLFEPIIYLDAEANY